MWFTLFHLQLGLQQNSGLVSSKLGSRVKPFPLAGLVLFPGLGAEAAQLTWPSLSWGKLSSHTGPCPGCRAGRRKLSQIGSKSDGTLGLQEVAGRTKWVA